MGGSRPLALLRRDGGHGAGDAAAARAPSPHGPVRSRCGGGEVRPARPEERRGARRVVGGAARSRGKAAGPAGVAALGSRSPPPPALLIPQRPPTPPEQSPASAPRVLLSHPP